MSATPSVYKKLFYNSPSLDTDATLRHELGTELRQLDMGRGIGCEELRLAVPELFGERLEARVLEQGPVAGQLQELRVGRGVRERGEVGVVELEPLLGPRTTSCLVLGLRAIRSGLNAAVSELGLLRTESR